MATIDPKRINQQSVDTGQEVTADGVPLQQAAAPTGKQSVTQSKEGVASMEDLPLTEDSPKAGEAKSKEEQSTKEVETPAAEEAKVPDFTDFLKAGSDEKFIPEEKKADTKENVQQENKEEDEPIKAGIKEASDNQVVNGKQLTKAEKIAQDKKTRDTTGLPEELATHFKEDMSRSAFEKIAPLVKEHANFKQQITELTANLEKAKKGGIPDSYYEHPNAYVLSPEFTTSSQRVSAAQTILNHWQEQYTELRGGAAEITDIGYDASGNLVETGKIKADPGMEVKVLNLLNTTQNQLIKEQAKLESLAITHKDKHTQTLQWLNNYEAQRVGIFDKEEGKKFLPQVQQILKSFPVALQTNPLALSVAKRDLVINQLATIIQDIQKQMTEGTNVPNKPVNGKSTTQQRVQQTRRAAGPTASDTGADSSNSNGKQEVTFDAFEAVKNGY